MRYHALVLGAGRNGVTLARALADRGWQVALVERERLPLECECGTALHLFQGHGRLLAPGWVSVRNELLEAERIFLNTGAGRRANTDEIGLEAAGVDRDERGFIRVNDRLETSVPGIWALGDVRSSAPRIPTTRSDHQVVLGSLSGSRTRPPDPRESTR